MSPGPDPLGVEALPLIADADATGSIVPGVYRYDPGRGSTGGLPTPQRGVLWARRLRATPSEPAFEDEVLMLDGGEVAYRRRLEWQEQWSAWAIQGQDPAP